MLKILKKISCLEILLIILLIYLIYNFAFKKNCEGFIQEKKSFFRHSDSDIYDDFYVNIYDKILFNSDKNDFEISYIFPKTSNSYSSIGAHTLLFTNIPYKQSCCNCC